MSRRRGAATVVAACAVVALSGCGASTAGGTPTATLPGTGGSPVVLTADPATCTPAAGAVTCTVRVWYANDSASLIDLDANLTRLVTRAGTVYRGATAAPVAANQTLRAGAKVSVDWSVTLPSGASLASVSWLGSSGDTASVAVVIATASAAPLPTHTSTPTSKPTPKPTPTPTSKPTPSPTPTPTRTRTPAPPTSSGPPASGSIG